MEAVVAGIVAYHIILLRAVNICREKQLSLGDSFVVGTVGGGIFVLTAHTIGYLMNHEIMLINGSVFYTLLASVTLLLLGGLRCLDARRGKL